MKKLFPVPVTGRGGTDADAQAQASRREAAIDILARTLWGEARGEGSAGMQAVANVVMNRVLRGGWWGTDIVSVCRKPYQFSCWNTGDPNRAAAAAVDGRDLYFATALRLARRAVLGALPDITGGADHYHAAGAGPVWSRGETPTAVIGRHIFYNLAKGQ